MDGEDYKRGDAWKSSGCKTCTCNKEGIECCASYQKLILADPDHCEAVLNENTCKMEAKRKDNTEQPCEIESVIA
ncbi:beta-microseminoprotein-like [Rhinoderma darwinii]|uniref:beta-microseminoprotein-like n=1 Tax=Rhinoderma darwinii TaxID=43563 RepID=UPI003F6706EF